MFLQFRPDPKSEIVAVIAAVLGTDWITFLLPCCQHQNAGGR